MGEQRTKFCILAAVLSALLACSGDRKSNEEDLPPQKAEPVRQRTPTPTATSDAASAAPTPAPAPSNVVVPKGAIRLRAAPAGWAFVQLTAATGTTHLPVQGGAVIGPKDWIRTINEDRVPFKPTWKHIRVGDASGVDTQLYINQPDDLGPGRYAVRIKLVSKSVDTSRVASRRWHFRTAERTQLRLGGVSVAGKRRFALLGDALRPTRRRSRAPRTSAMSSCV